MSIHFIFRTYGNLAFLVGLWQLLIGFGPLLESVATLPSVGPILCSTTCQVKSIDADKIFTLQISFHF